MTDTTKLPKWAQERIRRLEAERDAALRERDRAYGQNPGTDTAVVRGTDEALTLPKGANVRFTLDGGQYIDVRVATDHDGRPAIQVMGNDRIAVKPSASNVVFVRGSR